MPSLGTPELIIILLIVLVLFGANRLPEIGKAIGKSISEFKKSMREISEDSKPKEAPPQSTDSTSKSKLT